MILSQLGCTYTMKLVYWCAACLDDSRSYNIRTTTRREANQQRKEYGPERFGKPKKVIIEYRNAFDLITRVLGEGGAGEPDA